MYPPGHVGITALLISPVIYRFVATGRERAALTWLSVAVGLTLLPDVDAVLPGLVHRGITHTFLSAFALGIAVAAVCRLRRRSSILPRAKRARFGFLVGAGSVVSHLLGDVITPMGVRPFAPGLGTVYTLDLVVASDPAANLSLLVVGATTFGAVWYRARVDAAVREPDTADVDADADDSIPSASRART